MSKNNPCNIIKEDLKNDPRKLTSLDEATFLKDSYMETLFFEKHYQLKLQGKIYRGHKSRDLIINKKYIGT